MSIFKTVIKFQRQTINLIGKELLVFCLLDELLLPNAIIRLLEEKRLTSWFLQLGRYIEFFWRVFIQGILSIAGNVESFQLQFLICYCHPYNTSHTSGFHSPRWTFPGCRPSISFRVELYHFVFSKHLFEWIFHRSAVLVGFSCAYCYFSLQFRVFSNQNRRVSVYNQRGTERKQ